MVNYTSLANTAERLIEANGRTIQLVKPADTPLRDAAKPWQGVATPRDNGNEVEQDVIAVFIQVGTDTQFGEDEESESSLLIRAQSKNFLIAAKSLGATDLRTFTEIRDGTVAFNIVDITVLRPGDTDIIAFVEVDSG